MVHSFTHYIAKYSPATLPTNAPVIMSRLLLSVKPIPAAAKPEYEFSIDTITGISAPPTGIINNTPINSDTKTIRLNKNILLSERINDLIKRTNIIADHRILTGYFLLSLVIFEKLLPNH